MIFYTINLYHCWDWESSASPFDLGGLVIPVSFWASWGAYTRSWCQMGFQASRTFYNLLKSDYKWISSSTRIKVVSIILIGFCLSNDMSHRHLDPPFPNVFCFQQVCMCLVTFSLCSICMGTPTASMWIVTMICRGKIWILHKLDRPVT